MRPRILDYFSPVRKRKPMNFEGFDGIRGMAVMGRFVLVFAFLGLLFGLLVMLPVAYENNPPLSDKDGVAFGVCFFFPVFLFFVGLFFVKIGK